MGMEEWPTLDWRDESWSCSSSLSCDLLTTRAILLSLTETGRVTVEHQPLGSCNVQQAE